MKKSILLLAFLFMVIALIISSCATSGVIVADGDSDRGTSDGPGRMRIVGTDTTQDTKTLTIQITGPASKIDELTEATNGHYKIRYVLKKNNP